MTTTNKTETNSDEGSTDGQALVKLRALLAIRDYTDFEIRSKLAASYPEAEISDAIATARARGWLQTPEEQSARIAAKLVAKNKGIAFINETLESRGLPPLSTETASEVARARQLLDSKLARGVTFDYESKKKFYRLLASRGFEEDTIETVLQSAGFGGTDEF